MSQVLLSTRDTARLLGVQPNTLWVWRKAGRGPRALMLNRRLCKYRLADVEAWLASKALRGDDLA